MARQLLRLAAYTADARYDEAARKTLGLLDRGHAPVSAGLWRSAECR